ncbi:MAG: GH36 C-terminal domain-containing protein [Oscillospiraceae bacterium]|mgnify:FL=1
MRQPEHVFHIQYLRGLDPDRLYREEETGEVYSGALLMHAGLNLSCVSWESPDGDSLVRHFTAV